MACEKLRQGTFSLPCDEKCKIKASEREREEEELQRQRAAAEEEQNRVEMEEFQRKYGSKRPKERKQRQTSVDEGRNVGRIALIAAAIIVPIVGVLVYVFLN